MTTSILHSDFIVKQFLLFSVE